jgi:hypothetical protein
MSETVQQKMARQRAAREARDGTPDEQAAREKQKRGIAAVKRVTNSMKKLTRFANHLSNSPRSSADAEYIKRRPLRLG